MKFKKSCINYHPFNFLLFIPGLATHEAHFTIIREEFKPNQPRPCDVCGQGGHEKAECEGLPKVEGNCVCFHFLISLFFSFL